MPLLVFVQVGSGIYSITQNPEVVVVSLISEIVNKYGVVTVINHKLHCLICHAVCKHTLHVEELLSSETVVEDLDSIAASIASQQSSPSKAISPIGVSWMKTPFFLSQTHKKILCDGFNCFMKEINGQKVVVFPSDGLQLCSSCNSEMVPAVISLPLIMNRSICTASGSFKLRGCTTPLPAPCISGSAVALPM